MNKIGRRMPSCGIYKIENLVNGKIYIGQSKQKRGIEQRLSSHINLLRNNMHPNEHMQSSYNKYGELNFSFTIIEKCNKEELDNREIYWINHFQTTDRNKGYNKKSGGYHNVEYAFETTEKMRRKRLKLTSNGEMIGENHPRATITEEQVEIVKTSLAIGESVSIISKETGINLGIIKSIKSLDAWVNIREDLNELILQSTKKKNEPIDVKDVEKVKILLSEGKTIKMVVEITGLNKSVIFDIKRLKTFKHIYPQLNDKIKSFKNNKDEKYNKDLIIKLYSDGLKNKDVAEIIGCDPSYVSHCVRNKGGNTDGSNQIGA